MPDKEDKTGKKVGQQKGDPGHDRFEMDDPALTGDAAPAEDSVEDPVTEGTVAEETPT